MTDSPQPSNAAVIRVHQQVVLAAPLPEHGLEVGDVDIVVHVYQGGKVFEIEFLTLDGETAAIATLKAGHIRPVRRGDVAHARRRVAG